MQVSQEGQAGAPTGEPVRGKLHPPAASVAGVPGRPDGLMATEPPEPMTAPQSVDDCQEVVTGTAAAPERRGQ